MPSVTIMRINKSLLSTAAEADKQLLELYTNAYRLGEIVTVYPSVPKLCKYRVLEKGKLKVPCWS